MMRVQLAQLYSLDGNIQAAERALEAALFAADSESAEARFWLGSLRLREGRVKLALSDFRACVRSRPAQVDCHRLDGAFLVGNGPGGRGSTSCSWARAGI